MHLKAHCKSVHHIKPWVSSKSLTVFGFLSFRGMDFKWKDKSLWLYKKYLKGEYMMTEFTILGELYLINTLS